MSVQSKKQGAKVRFKTVRRIGEGTYGCVNEVVDNLTGVTLAMKKIKFVTEDQGVPINALREISLLKLLQHPNIVKIHQVYYNWGQTKLYFTLDFQPQNLHQHEKIHRPLSPNSIKVLKQNIQSYIHQTLTALVFMQSHCVMHRDLKPQNILVRDGKVKLCDFGQAKMFDPNNNSHTEDIATLWYKAPQIVLGAKEYNQAIDVWSVGCIMAELVQGYPLFRTHSQVGHIFAVFQKLGTPRIQEGSELRKWKYFNGSMPKMEAKPLQLQKLSASGNDLLRQMLQVQPAKRINAAKALKHDYFDGL